MMKLILGSTSPRRRELLREAGYAFTVSPVKVSEIFDENMNPREVASHLATVKSSAWVEANKSSDLQGILLLSADTVVILGDQILGKPADAAEARSFLARLSARTHSVMTGLSLVEPATGKTFVGADTTEITFRNLNAREISDYVDRGEPMDKAGAYGLQGAAREFVTKRLGSWSNVVGLPLELLENALVTNGWNVDRRTP